MLETSQTVAEKGQPPFDSMKLDSLMQKAGLDLLLVTSKHNVQYMLGGHRSVFFHYMDAMGLSRYLPVLIYARGHASRTIYVGHRAESNQRMVKPFWLANAETAAWGSTDSIEKAMAHVQREGFSTARIGIEPPFLPFDSGQTLMRVAPESELVDAVGLLERLRACKTENEVALLRLAAEGVLDCMREVLDNFTPGMTTAELHEALRRSETDRGLVFEYCLIAAGTSHNRAPSGQVINPGDVISLDSGANKEGYLGDVARMGIVGSPDAELRELLRLIDEMQRSAFEAVQPGALGGQLYLGPQAIIERSPLRENLHFVAHGMGLVAHEVPHLTTKGPVPYPDDDARRPLQPGMIVSIESTLRHPTRGFIKLEDTVAVTETGCEVLGDAMRGWYSTGRG